MTTALAILAGALLAGGAAVVSACIVSTTINRGFKRMSQATDRLTASVQAASASADALIARIATIPAPAPSDDTAVNAAADQIDALKTKLDATLPASAPTA